MKTPIDSECQAVLGDRLLQVGSIKKTKSAFFDSMGANWEVLWREEKHASVIREIGKCCRVVSRTSRKTTLQPPPLGGAPALHNLGRSRLRIECRCSSH